MLTQLQFSTDGSQLLAHVSLRFLRTPLQTQPSITITQEPDAQAPAPTFPLTPFPLTPAPFFVRVRPPKPPIAPRSIIIQGKVIPPTLRKVIGNPLQQLAPKTRYIIFERWLGYQRRTRRGN
jgi:hypothetical protein